MTLVVLGVAKSDSLDHDLEVFEAAGFRRLRDMATIPEGDAVLGVAGGGEELLRDADNIGLKYVLVHEGEADGHAGGTYERAHHRVEAGELAELATHLRSRKRPLITCLAFGYKNGAPADAALLIDARFLDNPYWVPALRERTGHDPAVAEFVLSQPAATRLLDDLHRMVKDLMPLYHEKGRMHLVIAFGCTGGRHRSVVLASEMANRLRAMDGVDVDFVTRDI
ncbi:MAG TPA: RNase adapter RapZ [Candidatus Dormibacteraeota bacterium]|nr:RNase adapter RapZ [Candidatus Dormibacteraeota bacterium]